MLELITACALGALTTLEVPAFSRVQVAGPIDVEITVDPNAARPVEVRLEGDEKAVARVEAKVEGGTLMVRAKGSSGWGWMGRDGARLSATVKALEAVEVTGSGDLVVRGLGGTPLRVRSSGSGDVRLSGRIGDLDARLAGSGDLEAEGLEASRVEIALSGSGDVELAGRTAGLRVDLMGSGDIDAAALVAGDVRARIMGSGDIMVCAEGEVDEQVMGSGEVQVKCR